MNSEAISAIAVLLSLYAFVALLIFWINQKVRWVTSWRQGVCWLFAMLGMCIWGPSLGVCLQLFKSELWVCALVFGGLVFGFAIGKLFVFLIDSFRRGPVEDSEPEPVEDESDHD
jgi:hypothetical protein